MKYNWCTLALLLEASPKKYFRVLIYDVGDQVSPTTYLFCTSPLTTILNFNLSRLPSYWIFSLHISTNGFNALPFYGSFIRKVWLLINFSTYFRFSFSQIFFTPAGILETSAKFLGYGMKCDTSDSDFPKVGNELFN